MAKLVKFLSFLTILMVMLSNIAVAGVVIVNPPPPRPRPTPTAAPEISVESGRLAMGLVSGALLVYSEISRKRKLLN